MTGSMQRVELERCRDAVGELLGFSFEADRLEQLGAVVRGRVSELGLSGPEAYLARLHAPEHRASEAAALAELVTVTETFFHRNYDQIRAFIEAVVPERLARGRRLRILSAGCASGEEPYTVAIALREAFPDVDTWDLTIVGIDVNPSMLAKARRARYGPWSLRATPEPIKARYFEQVGSEYVLSSAITNMVELREHNLADRGPWPFENFEADAIFCRNVIMYFVPEVMQRVVGRLTRTLGPGGYLFLGHAETLRGLSHDYHLCHTHGTFYYEHKSGGPTRSASDFSHGASSLARGVPPDVVLESTSWFDAIQAASRRVAELASEHGSAGHGARTSPSKPAPPLARRRLAEVLDLVQRERFSEALELLEALPADASGSTDALLLSAVLLTNHGRIAEAERACEKLLDADDLNAGAHYLKALCREHAQDDVGAAEHDRIAAHLDPTFAMPRLHAGLLAKRSRNPGAARRELGLALVLLEREDMSRLVLFGGGFSRDALTALCRNELARLGDGP